MFKILFLYFRTMTGLNILINPARTTRSTFSFFKIPQIYFS